MIKRSLLLILAFILSLAVPVLAAEPGDGTIEGQIVNGTAGSSNVSDQEITLKNFINDADTESGSATTKTDAEGRFVFNNLSTESTYSYQVTLSFQEADYFSEQLAFAGNEAAKSVELMVYDSTMSDEAIKVTVAHTVIYPEPGSLRVEEYFTFVNNSDRTYIGSGEITATGTRRTLKLPPLPSKATGLQYGGEFMECCVLNNADGFSDTMAVYPGAKELIYAYQVDYRSGQYPFSWLVNYPTDTYNLLVQGGNVEITEGQLTRQQPVNIEGNQFNYLSGTNLAAGDTIAVQLSGLPQASSQWTVIWIVLVLLILGGGAVYLLRKRKLQPVVVESSPLDRRQRLLAELAKLDDDLEDGKIPEEVYQRRRAERKAQLVELMSRSKGKSGNR